MRKFVPAWSALIVVALLMAFVTLTGCGGVSSARPAPPTPTPSPNPTPNPSPSPSPSPTPAAHGTFVFVGGIAGTDGFRLNPDGTMTAIAGSPFPIPGPIAAGGAFLFAASGTTVTSFKVNPVTGVPAAAGSATISNAMAITADARNVYVAGVSADGANNVIYGFSVAAASGALTALSGSPYQYTQNCELCDQPDSMALNNNFVIVGGTGFHGVGDFTVYTRAGTGVLGPEQLVGTDEEGGVAIQHPGGNAAYGIDGIGGDITAFHIDSSGKATGANGFSPITFTFVDETVDPTGRFLLADDGSGTVHVFTIDPATANITQAGTSETAGDLAGQIAMDPSGRFVFLAQSAPAPNQITVFSFDPANGAMKKLQAFPLSQAPGIIATVTE